MILIIRYYFFSIHGQHVFNINNREQNKQNPHYFTANRSNKQCVLVLINGQTQIQKEAKK